MRSDLTMNYIAEIEDGGIALITVSYAPSVEATSVRQPREFPRIGVIPPKKTSGT